MSAICLPRIPAGHQIYTSTQVEFTADTTNSFGTGRRRPVSATVGAFTTFFPDTETEVELAQLDIEVTATSTYDALPLRLLCYTTTAPTTPTLNANYDPSTTNLLGVIKILAADYLYVDENVAIATLTRETLATNRSTTYFKGGTGANGTTLYMVALYDTTVSGGPYSAGATIKIRTHTIRHIS